MNAFTNSGPWFTVGGPKMAPRSVPCNANGTEYWYLYDVNGDLAEYASTSQ